MGCGNGFDLRQLVARGWCRQIVGLDLSSGMLAAVADRREAGRVALVNGDAQQLLLAGEREAQ